MLIYYYKKYELKRTTSTDYLLLYLICKWRIVRPHFPGYYPSFPSRSKLSERNSTFCSCCSLKCSRIFEKSVTSFGRRIDSILFEFPHCLLTGFMASADLILKSQLSILKFKTMIYLVGMYIKNLNIFSVQKSSINCKLCFKSP